jgi:hypothetical protein
MIWKMASRISSVVGLAEPSLLAGVLYPLDGANDQEGEKGSV